MATHSSVLAWRVPGMGEPGGLPSMGLHRVGHDWSDLAAAAAAFRGNKFTRDNRDITQGQNVSLPKRCYNPKCVFTKQQSYRKWSKNWWSWNKKWTNLQIYLDTSTLLIKMDTEKLNNINKQDLIDICGTFHPIIAEHTFKSLQIIHKDRPYSGL